MASFCDKYIYTHFFKDKRNRFKITWVKKLIINCIIFIASLPMEPVNCNKGIQSKKTNLLCGCLLPLSGWDDK